MLQQSYNGRCCLRAFYPRPDQKVGHMSTKFSFGRPISPSDFKTIQSVLDQADCDASSIASAQPRFDKTALLMMKPFLSGKCAYSRTAQVEYSFDQTQDKAVLHKMQLPRYAIQRPPGTLSKSPVRGSPSPEADDVDVQAWENEGGAVNRSRARRPFRSDGRIIPAV